MPAAEEKLRAPKIRQDENELLQNGTGNINFVIHDLALFAQP
jgi:hypothetical protein